MFDIYIWEAHNNENLMDFINIDETYTLEERIANYERYKEKYDMTLPALIDNPEGDNSSNPGNWANSWYDSSPTGCYLINKEGVLCYLINFILSSGQYPRIDGAVEDALDETTGMSKTKQKFMEKIACQISNGKLSIVIPDEGKYNFEIVNALGKSMVSKTGNGAKIYNLSESLAAGVYLFKIVTDEQTMAKPLIIK